MASFPTIQSANGISQSIIKKAFFGSNKHGFNDISERQTIAKMEFKVSYNTLTLTEMNTLQTFFENNQGTAFDWTHPEEGGSVYTVVFNQDSLQFTWLAFGLWSITFNIKEV